MMVFISNGNYMFWPIAAIMMMMMMMMAAIGRNM